MNVKLKALPQYWDDEVRGFHPYFEKYLNEVLTEMGLDKDLELIHHWTTKGFSGIIDFAICNRASKKVFLAIEVKKTPLDLKAIGRKQARGYLEDLGSFRGSDYYLATNLEFVELFRDTPERKLTIAQLLNLPTTYVGNLKKDKFEDFTENLKLSLKAVLSTVKANDGTNYASNISGLLHALETSLDDSDSWHQAQAYYGFDYIRGALSNTPRLKDVVSKWSNAGKYASDPDEMSKLASEINFDLIYKREIKGRFNDSEVSQIAAGAFEAGSESDFAEDLSDIVNEIAYKVKRIPGAVDTSLSLASLLALHAQSEISETDSKMKVLDPGCGTGGLLAAIKRQIPTLRADQVIGIEKEEIFRSALSLKVGLIFGDDLSKNNHPNLSIAELESISPDALSDVGLVVMNPPFIRGIDCVQERLRISKLVKSLTGNESTLTKEQLGYECGFLELVTALVPEGTVIATVFPKNALLREDSSSVRKFFLEKFGLKQIITYPDEDLFGSVQKSTVLLIGKKNSKSAGVDVYSYKTQLSEVNFQQYSIGDKSGDESQIQVETANITSERLLESLSDGWKSIISTEEVSLTQIQEMIFSETVGEPLAEKYNLYRGTIGNKGASDLLFNPKTSCLDSQANIPSKWSGIPKSWIAPAAKNSDGITRRISQSEGESGLVVSKKDIASAPLVNLVDQYIATQLENEDGSPSTAAQKKKTKTAEEIIGIIEISRPLKGPLVLIPRAQRVTAQISYSLEPNLLVSTNFFTFSCETESEVLMMSSWLLSIFGQIQFEFLGIDQEGMRKVEKNQIGKCLIPSDVTFDEQEIQALKDETNKAKPLNFRKIDIRPVDILWAKKIAPESWEELLQVTQSVFQDLCHQRLQIS
jgi:predicted RNA methylase